MWLGDVFLDKIPPFPLYSTYYVYISINVYFSYVYGLREVYIWCENVKRINYIYLQLNESMIYFPRKIGVF